MRLKATLCLVTLALLSLPAQAANSPVNTATIARSEAIYHMNAGRYSLAEAYFRQAIKEFPKDATLHYYLANDLVYQSKHAQAVDEYSCAYALDPYGPVSGYCRHALSTYHAVVPGTAGGDHPPPPPIAVIERATAANSAVGVAPSVKSVSRIRAQADSEKGRSRSAADALASGAIKTGQKEAADIQSEAAAQIHQIYNPPWVSGTRSSFNPYYNPAIQQANAEEVKRNADEAARIATDQANEKANAYKQWAKMKESGLDDTASSLERQLHDRNLPGTPRLSETGTGLYVRNYAQPEQPSPYPDAHQGVARIRSVAVGPQDADRGNERELHARPVAGSFDDTNNTVRGTVLSPNKTANSQ